jgi:hypothetical protein
VAAKSPWNMRIIAVLGSGARGTGERGCMGARERGGMGAWERGSRGAGERGSGNTSSGHGPHLLHEVSVPHIFRIFYNLCP